jgi:hypothetical protein
MKQFYGTGFIQPPPFFLHPRLLTPARWFSAAYPKIILTKPRSLVALLPVRRNT